MPYADYLMMILISKSVGKFTGFDEPLKWLMF